MKGPTLRTLDEAAKSAEVSRRLIQVWLARGWLKRWQIPGDRKRYADLDELIRLRTPRTVAVDGVEGAR